MMRNVLLQENLGTWMLCGSTELLKFFAACKLLPLTKRPYSLQNKYSVVIFFPEDPSPAEWLKS